MRRHTLLALVSLVTFVGVTKPADAYFYYGWGYDPPVPPVYYYPYGYSPSPYPYGYEPPPYDEPPRPYWRPRTAGGKAHLWRRPRVQPLKSVRHRPVGRVAPRGLVNPLLGPLPSR